MRIFTILSGTYKKKQIEVIKYKVIPTGVHIEIKHNLPAVKGKSFRWVQTLSSNHPFIKRCKLPHVVDPFGNWDPSIHKLSLPGITNVCKADDLKPYYWTDPQYTGSGPNIVDLPQSNSPSKGRYWWKFVTTLAEVTGKNVHHLVGISWGYDRLQNGNVHRAVIKRATVSQMKNHNQALKKMYSKYKFT